jgi:signal transduction histidine kinase
MSPGDTDPRPETPRAAGGSTPTNLPKLLSLTVHEFRSPLTVVSGYIRMLLKDRAGPLQDQQRRILEEAEKSCARLSTLLAEVSELAHLEAGTATFNRSPVDLLRLLREAAAELAPLPDREITIDVDGEPVRVNGDAVRLKGAFTSLLLGLRRELVTSNRIAVRVQRHDGAPATAVVTICEEARVERLLQTPASELAAFDEWRGGSGLSLATARRIVAAHGGRISGGRDDGKAVAVIAFPVAD